MKLIDFIEQSNTARSLYELIKLYSSALEQYGYDQFMCFTAQGPLIDIPTPINGKLHYTPSVINAYDKRKFAAIDPIFQLFHCARRPFTWEQVRCLPLSDEQKLAMDLRREGGMLNGFSIPVMNYDQELIGISLGSTLPDPRDDADALAYLYALTNQFRLRRAEMLHHTALPTAPFKVASTLPNVVPLRP